jgi:hypothetical protein
LDNDHSTRSGTLLTRGAQAREAPSQDVSQVDICYFLIDVYDHIWIFDKTLRP